MRSNDSIHRFTLLVLTLVCIVVVVLFAVITSAAQPPCTGDRHEYCVPTTTIATATTTTLPILCPDPAPCPAVICDCTPGNPFAVNVARCAAPNYLRCRYLKDGTMKCPIRDHPRRVLHSEGQ